eukprot:8456314-Pyramimonas_sp.AAC.1
MVPTQVFVRFPDAVPLGIRTRDGRLLLNPPADTVVNAHDEIFVLAEDDDTYSVMPYDPERLQVSAGPLSTAKREKQTVSLSTCYD